MCGVVRCMSVWVDDWMCGWVDLGVRECMDAWVDGWVCEWMDEGVIG